MKMIRQAQIGNAAIAALTVLLFIGAYAHAQTAPPAKESAFSFAVYGDSRSMMYLPYLSNQKEEATKLVVDMFELVLPEKVAEGFLGRGLCSGIAVDLLPCFPANCLYGGRNRLQLAA